MDSLPALVFMFVLLPVGSPHAVAPADSLAQQSPSSELTMQQAQDVERFRAYQTRLVEVAARLSGTAPLTSLIRPLVQLAAERSAEGTATLENRALILTLGFYLHGTNLAFLVPEAADWPQPRGRNIVLLGRDDLAKHFMISAAVAAAAGGPLAAWVGLYKEMQDTRGGGSGFSFTDLAADRAGARFGLAATGTSESARRLQTHIQADLSDADLMPDISGLPEALSTAELTRRFGGPNGAAYDALVAEIDRRVAGLRMLLTAEAPVPVGGTTR